MVGSMAPLKFLILVSVFGYHIGIARRITRSTNHICKALNQSVPNPQNGIYQCAWRVCPTYQELPGHVKDMTNVTVRKVNSGVYATRTATNCSMTESLYDSYMPLHRYFYGQEYRMNRTLPILLFTTKMEEDHRCDYTHQLNFYLPPANQTNYPQPSDQTVEVVAKQPECFVVYHWIGKISSNAVFEKYNSLKTNLTNNDEFTLDFDDDVFAHARYDPSCRPNPRNEIWIPLDSCPDDNTS